MTINANCYLHTSPWWQRVGLELVVMSIEALLGLKCSWYCGEPWEGYLGHSWHCEGGSRYCRWTVTSNEAKLKPCWSRRTKETLDTAETVRTHLTLRLIRNKIDCNFFPLAVFPKSWMWWVNYCPGGPQLLTCNISSRELRSFKL